MRRRLIQQSDFDKILNESVATAKKELVEAESILGHALGKEFLTLKSFTESTVIYEAKDGTYVQAGYQIRNGKVTFSNVEEVVIDEASQKEKRRNILSDMLEAIVTDNEEKAKAWNKYRKFWNKWYTMQQVVITIPEIKSILKAFILHPVTAFNCFKTLK